MATTEVADKRSRGALRWLRAVSRSTALAVGVGILAVVSGVVTYVTVTGLVPYEPTPAVLLGLLGAAIGLLLGIWLARWLGSRALELTPDHFRASRDVLFYVLGGAPLLSALASYLPTLWALVQDPAVVLREP